MRRLHKLHKACYGQTLLSNIKPVNCSNFSVLASTVRKKVAVTTNPNYTACTIVNDQILYNLCGLFTGKDKML